MAKENKVHVSVPTGSYLPCTILTQRVTSSDVYRTSESPPSTHTSHGTGPKLLNSPIEHATATGSFTAKIIGSWCQHCRDYTTIPLLAPTLSGLRALLILDAKTITADTKLLRSLIPALQNKGFLFEHIVVCCCSNLKTSRLDYISGTVELCNTYFYRSSPGLAGFASFSEVGHQPKTEPQTLEIQTYPWLSKRSLALVCWRCKAFLTKWIRLGESTISEALIADACLAC